MKYDNWQLTKKSDVLDTYAIQKLDRCPFKFSLNQLWRNMLLAENVSRVRRLDEFHFWVLFPKQNTFLMDDHKESVEQNFRGILTAKGNNCFRLLHLDSDFVTPLEALTDNEEIIKLLQAFRRKYLVQES